MNNYVVMKLNTWKIGILHDHVILKEIIWKNDFF